MMRRGLNRQELQQLVGEIVVDSRSGIACKIIGVDHRDVTVTGLSPLPSKIPLAKATEISLYWEDLAGTTLNKPYLMADPAKILHPEHADKKYIGKLGWASNRLEYGGENRPGLVEAMNSRRPVELLSVREGDKPYVVLSSRTDGWVDFCSYFYLLDDVDSDVKEDCNG